MKHIITKSPVQTFSIGYKLGRRLSGRSAVITLSGDLGSGKTCFVKGLAAGLGIKKHVVSPTFVFIRVYKNKKTGASTLYHVDLYRMRKEDGIQNLGLDEIISKPRNIMALEWPRLAKKILPRKTLNFYFSFGKNISERKIASKSSSDL